MLFREPLVLPVLAIGLGIVLNHLWPGEHPLTFALACMVVAALALVLKTARPIALAACLIGIVLSGALIDSAHKPPPPPRLDVPDLSLTILEGCVVEPPALGGDREQFLLELGKRARTRVVMFAHPGEQLPKLHYGERLEVEGKLRAPRNFGNPAAFDYRNYLARQDIFWSLSALKLRPLSGACGNAWDQAISNLRTAALDRIAGLYQGDQYNTAMMDAVLIGESSGLDRLWTEQYRSTGTFHALVISGSHVAVLAGFFLFLLRLCFIPKLPATLLTVMAAWLYALVTGWQAPVIRSAAGMTLFALGGLFFRDRRLLNLLAGVALCFLVVDPDQIFDPSFQLSFLAVAFLAVFAVPIIEHTSGPLAAAAQSLDDLGRDPHLRPAISSRRVELRLYAETVSLWTRLPERFGRFIVCAMARVAAFFWDIFITSLVIQAGLALPMALYFHRVSFTGLSANAVVVPLLGFVVPIGFVALFTNLRWIAAVAAFLLDLSRRTVDFHARYEPNWRIPTPPVALSLIICVALGLAAVRWKSKWVRFGFAAALAALLAVLIVSPFPAHLRPKLLEMTAIDVGQGDAIFLAMPDGKTMMVDSGGIPSFGNRTPPNPTPVKMEIGEDVVAPYLWTRAIRCLDVVAISHLHDDHVGGIPAILNDFDVKELWVGVTPPCPAWDKIQAKAKERGTAIRRLRQGDWVRFGKTDIQVLEPAPDYTPADHPGNNDSLVLRVVYGKRSILLTGDMEKPVEAEMVNQGHWPHTDILKIGHHGSKSSSTPEFLDQVRPAFGVISDGYGNLYGHPHAVTLDKLRERHVLTYRTDRDGLVTLLTDGNRIWRD